MKEDANDKSKSVHLYDVVIFKSFLTGNFISM